MKHHIIIAVLGLASAAHATNLVASGNNCNNAGTQPLYYCNLPTVTDSRTSRTDSDGGGNGNSACSINTTYGGGTANCGGGIPSCGGGTPPTCNTPDAASSLGLLGGTLAMLGALRRKFAPAK